MDGLKAYSLIDGKWADFYDPDGIYNDFDILFVGHTSPLGGILYDREYLLTTISSITVGSGGFGGGSNGGGGIGGFGNGGGGIGGFGNGGGGIGGFGGGGIGGNGGSGINGGGGPKSLAEALDTINERIKDINGPADLALFAANKLTREKFSLLVKLGRITGRIGIATGLVDAGLALNNYSQGKPWVEHAINAGIVGIAIFGSEAALVSIGLGILKETSMSLYEWYKNNNIEYYPYYFEQWIKDKAYPGY